jgi:quinol monooxygenase YgiN
MLIVHVQIHVHPPDVARFIDATLANARASRKEPGIARFDLIQQSDDPTWFVLIEHYRTPDDPARHKATAHYATWRDTVAAMMAEPRRGVTYHEVSPDEAGGAAGSA